MIQYKHASFIMRFANKSIQWYTCFYKNTPVKKAVRYIHMYRYMYNINVVIHVLTNVMT